MGVKWSDGAGRYIDTEDTHVATPGGSTDEATGGQAPAGSAHSPLPWRRNQLRGAGIFSADDRLIAGLGPADSNDQCFANAEFIVLAVNHHHELVEALKKWRGGACGCTDIRCQMCRDFDAVLAKVNA